MYGFRTIFGETIEHPEEAAHFRDFIDLYLEGCDIAEAARYAQIPESVSSFWLLNHCEQIVGEQTAKAVQEAMNTRQRGWKAGRKKIVTAEAPTQFILAQGPWRTAEELYGLLMPVPTS